MRNHSIVARESVWVQIGGVVLFVALVALFSQVVRPQLSGPGLVAAGVALAIVPAVLWLWMFYRADRFEPEPRQYVLGVFFVGGLLAYAIGQPVIRTLFRVQDWSGDSMLTAVLAAILVSGLVQQFLLYAAVRYTVFNSAEFDQRVDGIIYGAAAGLGYATLYNVQYVVGNSGVDLGVGAIEIAVEALSLASLGGISGYFLARAKFDKMGPLWLPIGLILAATLNGLVDLSLEQVPWLGTGFGFNPWYGLTGAVIVAGVVFALLFQLIQKINLPGPSASPAGSVQSGAQAPSVLDRVLIGEGRSEEPEWVVWLVVAVGLALGGLLAAYTLGQTRTVTSGPVAVTIPSRWGQATEPGTLLAVYDLQGGGVFGTRVSVRQSTKADLVPEQGSIQDAAATWALQREKSLSGFRLLNIETSPVKGREAAHVEYAYVMDSNSASGDAMPALMHAVDTLVAAGDQVYVLTFAAESHQYDAVRSLRDQILAGWRIPQ